MWHAMATLQAGLAVAEAIVPPTSAPTFDPEFTRAHDTTIVKVNAAFEVCKNLVHDSLLAALGAAADAA